MPGRPSSFETSPRGAASPRWLPIFGRPLNLDEKGFRRIFARGGGAPETVGSDVAGHLMVPSIALHFLVRDCGRRLPMARDRLDRLSRRRLRRDSLRLSRPVVCPDGLLGSSG